MENCENKVNEEITLVDLFSVFIRYRKLIILGTIILSILGIFCFNLISKYNQNSNMTYSAEYIIPFKINKNYINGLIDYDFANDSVLKFKTIGTVANINKEFNMLNYSFINEQFNQLDYNKFIYDVVENKIYDVKLNPTKSAIVLSVKTNSIEAAEKFVKTLVDNLNKQYYDYLLPLVSNKLEVLNDIFDSRKQYGSFNPIINENELLKEQLGLQTILKNNIEIFDTVQTSLVLLNEKDSNLKVYILIVIASFCVFVFIAFLLNAIKNIESNKFAFDKINSAWNSGKKLFP